MRRSAFPSSRRIAGWPTSLAIVAVALLVCPSMALAQKTLLQRDSKRECATCHIDWIDSFERPGAVLLMDRPAKPMVAEEPMCLDCHDGAIGDSRRNVWLEHGHRRGEKPSDKIKVPANLPLEDGKMVCRTCHTAHTVPGATDIAKIVFLRSANEGGLCQQCHVDRAYGQEHGSHPLAKLPFELPKEIKDAHGRTDIADRTKMACQTCHSTHGPTKDHLLVLSTESGQLCITCHEKLRPMEWKVDAPREHPQNPKLKNDAQKQAIAAMGTKLGPGETLTCFSCHRMHESKSGKFMLADTLKDSALCIRCHEDRKIVLDSKHDLRKTRPEAKNRLDLTAEQSGPCGSCHSFHRYARETTPGRGDPVGRCITCHQPKGAPGLDQGLALGSHSGLGLGFAHPPDIPAAKIPANAPFKLLDCKDDPTKKSLACNTCHDPHDASKTLFLKVDKNNLCSSCHQERFGAMAGKHDFTKQPELKNARGWTAEQSGKCGFCHAVHGDNDLVMWVGTKDKPKGADDLCLQCHKDAGLAAKKPAAMFNHPTGPKARPGAPGGAVASEKLPLFDEHALIAKNGFVACSSCHDPHADSTKQKEMLRVASPTSNLCTQCHTDKAQMAGGVHDGRDKKEWPAPEAIAAAKSDLCVTCHRPHSNDPERKRWAFVPAKDTALHDAACVSCHQKNAFVAAPPETPLDARRKPPAGEAIAVADAGDARVGLDPIARVAEAIQRATDMGAKASGGAGAMMAMANDARTARAQAQPVIPPGKALHPTTLPSRGHAGTLKSGLPLVSSKADGPADSIGCRTCHDPHAKPGTVRLARIEAGQTTESLCTKCHAEAAHMASGMHARDALLASASEPRAGIVPVSAKQIQGGACAPCHATHAIEGSQRRFLWSAKVAPDGPSDSDRRCLACHDPGRTVDRDIAFEHPTNPMQAFAAASEDADAAANPSGRRPTTRPAGLPLTQIKCVTCHTPHGGMADGAGKAGGKSGGAAAGEVAVGANGAMTPAALADLDARRASRPMLRSDAILECSKCHGLDASRVMLYWHTPSKRTAAGRFIGK